MKRAILVLGLWAAAACGAFAHPHVFIDTRIEVAGDQTGVTGFWITWGFDKMFAASILLDFDRDKNRSLSPSEVEAVRTGAFSNLANYKYFLYLRSSQGLYRPASVRDFSAYVEGERLYYRFFVPDRLPLSQEETEVNLAVYDETFFCAIRYFEQDPVLFPDSAGIRGSYAIREDRGIRIDYPDNQGAKASTFPLQGIMKLKREPSQP
jgi:ABC-type uncharacterized transport system substrate-binding protein